MDSKNILCNYSLTSDQVQEATGAAGNSLTSRSTILCCQQNVATTPASIGTDPTDLPVQLSSPCNEEEVRKESEGCSLKRKKVSGSEKRRRRRLKRMLEAQVDTSISNGGNEVTNEVHVIDNPSTEPNQIDTEQIERRRNPCIVSFPIKTVVVPEEFPAQNFDEDGWQDFVPLLFAKMEADTRAPYLDIKRLIDGALHVSCREESDVDWLREALAGETIQGMSVKVMYAKDILMPIKVAWKTRNRFIIDNARVLKLLNRYHPTLRTNQWKVINTLVEDTYVRRILLIDRISADYIKKCGHRLHNGLCIDLFKVLQDSGATQVERQVSSTSRDLYAESHWHSNQQSEQTQHFIQQVSESSRVESSSQHLKQYEAESESDESLAPQPEKKWWTRELEISRIETRRLYDRAIEENDFTQYQKAQSDFNYQVRRARRNAWESPYSWEK